MLVFWRAARCLGVCPTGAFCRRVAAIALAVVVEAAAVAVKDVSGSRRRSHLRRSCWFRLVSSGAGVVGAAVAVARVRASGVASASVVLLAVRLAGGQRTPQELS